MVTPTLSPRVPLPGVNRVLSGRACPARALPRPLAASEADAIGTASGAGKSTMAGLPVGLGPASTGEIRVGGFEHRLARRADAFETDVPPRYQEPLIVRPDERTSHGA